MMGKMHDGDYHIFFDVIADAIPGGLKISRDDESFSFEYVSEELASMFGYTVDEFMKASKGTAKDWSITEDRERVTEEVLAFFEKGDTYNVKYRVFRKDGTLRWVMDQGRRVIDSQGTPHYYSVITDITEQEQNIQLLRRERSQYRGALERNCEFSYTIDLTDGYLREDIIRADGTSVLDECNLKVPVLYDKVLTVFFKHRQVRNFRQGDNTPFCKDLICLFEEEGITYWEYEWKEHNPERYMRTNYLMARDDATSHIIAYCIVHDISDMRQKEEEAKKQLHEALENAEAANRAKTIFMNSMSHDIRTPMNVIVGMLHIMRDNIDNPTLLLDSMNKAEAASVHLQSLINDVLDMSKLESGRITVSNDEFNLRKLLLSLDEALQPIAQNRCLDYQSNISIEHEQLIGSSLLIHRLLQNIIVNAFNYNKPYGSVFFSTTEQPIDARHCKLTFIIKDTGIGIEKDFLDKIFEPFSRENKVSSTFQGTGLGMSIVKQIVDLLDGDIQIESEVNVGTCIRVDLPIEINTHAILEPETKNNVDCNLEGTHILLAEDNALNAEIATYILEQKGATITLANNGQIAVDLFKKAPPSTYDLILMDIMMPVMDGYTATKNIRSLNQADAKTIPIIAMTANAFVDDVKKCMDCGMNGHIAKPIDRHLLFKTLSKYL